MKAKPKKTKPKESFETKVKKGFALINKRFDCLWDSLSQVKHEAVLKGGGLSDKVDRILSELEKARKIDKDETDFYRSHYTSVDETRKALAALIEDIKALQGTFLKPLLSDTQAIKTNIEALLRESRAAHPPKAAAPSCKRCGTPEARWYGFCTACWEYLHHRAEKAFISYQNGIDAGPHDAHEEKCIFDDFVKGLWEVFKK
jgi:hypothetical protein